MSDLHSEPSRPDRYGAPHIPLGCMALRMLEYMVMKEGDSPFTVYHLMRFCPGRWLRRDRVREMLGMLMERGWVEALPGVPGRGGSVTTRYRATEKGRGMVQRSRDVVEFVLSSGEWRKRVHP
ncbi:MAG: hypothetical protein QXG10_03870 [Candidatus Hadarchaeales archaeon]